MSGTSLIFGAQFGLAKVVSDFIAVDLERGYECDVFYFVVPELGMH